MADTTGVQVFVGPANQLELGDVVEGPTGVTLETLSPSRQRITFSISAPTAEVVTAATDAAADASAAATDAAASKTAAQTAQTAASGAQTAANTSATAAQAAQTAAQTAAASVPTYAQYAEMVQTRLLPSNLTLDTDGVPYINPGANSVVVLNDSDGRPFFV